MNSNSSSEVRKGQQITMPIASAEDQPSISNGLTLKVIDLRKDWNDILEIIYKHHHIQRAIEKAYQNFQEGHKLKDFKYRMHMNGAWSFADIHQSMYPCILSTTNWLAEFEKREWQAQAIESEKEAMAAIDEAIGKCMKLTNCADFLDNLEASRNRLYLRHPPRPNQPETWRPQNASYWAAQWMKILAENYYADIANEWRIITGDSHSIVAGFTEDNTAYLLDIILLSMDTNEIMQQLLKS